MGIQIRNAEPEDAEGIARVDLDAHIAVYRPLRGDDYLAGTTVETTATRWRSRLEADGADRSSEVLVAEDAGGIIGYSTIGASRDADAEARVTGEVYTLYLHPLAWRRGFGSLLLNAATDRLRQCGYTAITLWVLDANEAARAFYSSHGWRPDGASEPSTGAPGTNLRYRAPAQSGEASPTGGR